MARIALAAFPVLVACGACSSQSASDFDHGRPTAGSAGFGRGERLEYPTAPYGATVGATVENFHFLGWSSPVLANHDPEALETIQLAHFYNPSGSENGLNYLVITSTAVWCSACKYEYQDMASGQVEAYRKRGVEFFGALFEDNDGNPATPADLVLWAQNFDVDFPFVLDPSLKFGNFFDREATPMEMIVDAKTMQVVDIDTGWATAGPGSLWAKLDQLLGG